MSEKKTYTPTEFAALFSREKTWTYRMLYAGKIEGITEYGRLMIPASEANRITKEGKRYKAKASDPDEMPKKKSQLRNTRPEDGASPWTKWIKGRKENSSRVKGMGNNAKPDKG